MNTPTPLLCTSWLLTDRRVASAGMKQSKADSPWEHTFLTKTYELTILQVLHSSTLISFFVFFFN